MIFAKRPPRPQIIWHTSWAILPHLLRDGRIAWLHNIGYKARDDDNRPPWVYASWDDIAYDAMTKERKDA